LQNHKVISFAQFNVFLNNVKETHCYTNCTQRRQSNMCSIKLAQSRAMQYEPTSSTRRRTI